MQSKLYIIYETILKHALSCLNCILEYKKIIMEFYKNLTYCIPTSI